MKKRKIINPLLISAAAAATIFLLGRFTESRSQDESKNIIIEEQVKNLVSRFKAERENAVSILSELPDAPLDTLEQIAKSKWVPARICAMRVLVRRQPEKYIDYVLNFENFESISMKIGARLISREIGIVGAKKLWADLDKAPEENKHAMREIIASATMDYVTKTLAGIVNSRTGSGQYPGQYKKLTSSGPVIEPALSKLITENSSPLTRAAAAALAELGEKAAIPVLKAAYYNNSDDMKIIAASALHILGENKEYEEMEDLLKKACSDGNQFAYNELALFYDRAKEYEKGVAVLKDMIRRFGASPTDHINLACLLSIQGKIDEAFEEFVEGVDKGYGDMEWVKIDGELANLRASKQFQSYVRTKFPEAFKEIQEKPEGK